MQHHLSLSAQGAADEPACRLVEIRTP